MTLGALLIGLTVGLIGFRQPISASYVAESLAIETVVKVALLGWTSSSPSRHRSTPRRK